MRRITRSVGRRPARIEPGGKVARGPNGPSSPPARLAQGRSGALPPTVADGKVEPVRRMVAVVLLAMVAAACGGGKGNGSVSAGGTTTSAAPTTGTGPSTTAAPSTTAVPSSTTTAAPSSASVDTFLGRVTLWRLEYPATGTDQANRSRSPGKVFALADVEACSKSGAPFSSQSFTLQTSDGRAWPGWKGPGGARDPDVTDRLAALSSPGQCARGWLTFELDPGLKVAAMVFRPLRSEQVFTLNVT